MAGTRCPLVAPAVKGWWHGRLRELRVPGRPLIRVFWAFGRYRTAILLIAGHKTDSECFYRDYVPRADRPLRLPLDWV